MDTLVAASAAEQSTAGAERWRLARIYIIEAMISVAGNLLTIGIYFYTSHKFGWQLRQNLLLATALGVVYVFGALAAHPLSERLGPRVTAAGVYLFSAAVLLLVVLFTVPIVAVGGILVFAFSSGVGWPVLESLVSMGELSPHELSRRVAAYNIVWAGVGAIVVAVNGVIIEAIPAGVFIIPVVVCAIAGAIAALYPLSQAGTSKRTTAPAAPEPQLARQRIVALWLSRICVPAMYIAIYALAALMPSLAVIKALRPATQTLASSVWLIARCLAFLGLGATAFWHTRPRLLLGAAVLLLVSFLVITVSPGELLTLSNSGAIDLMSMIAGQIVFGLACGMIYMASLYFGMVLSEGSTEHGGYHEALIGVGIALGPAAGAVAEWVRPGEPRAAVAAVSGLIALSILLAGVASLRLSRRGAR